MWRYTLCPAFAGHWSTSSRLNSLVYLSMRYIFYVAFAVWLCWTLESVSFSVWSKVLVHPLLADWVELVSVVRLSLLVYLGWTYWPISNWDVLFILCLLLAQFEFWECILMWSPCAAVSPAAAFAETFRRCVILFIMLQVNYCNQTCQKLHWPTHKKFCKTLGGKMGSRNSSVVRAPDLWSKGLGFESWQEQWENFLLQGQLSALFQCPFHPHITAAACKKISGHSAKSADISFQLSMQAPYICGFA